MKRPSLERTIRALTEAALSAGFKPSIRVDANGCVYMTPASDLTEAVNSEPDEKGQWKTFARG